MSDDEEIIYKGKSLGLYSYLSDLGYGDFETFESENLSKGEQFQALHDYLPDEYKERLTNSVSKPRLSTLHVTDHDYRKLETILGSQLLFKEDAHIVESLLHNKQVCNQRPNYVFHSTVFLMGLLSSVLMLRRKVNLGIGFVQYIVPAGFTFVFSCYSAWQFYKEFEENRREYILTTHINELKKLCFNVLKLTRFIKETEVLSTNQVPLIDIGLGSSLYLPTFKNNLVTNITDVSPQWRTLPHLRKCLSNTVEEVLNMLTLSVSSLRESLFDRESVENHLITYVNIPKPNLESCQPPETGCFVTLLDLTELTIKYLSVQSEYLKVLAFTFSPAFLNETKFITFKAGKHFNRDKVFATCVNLHKKIADSSFKLMMQYNIHNIASTFKKVSSKSSSKRQVTREINDLQNDVHNVFLLLYSALLRVRNLEDTLEKMSEIGESVKLKDKLPVGGLSLDVTEQLTILKDDLISTVRCYDVLCQQVTSKTTNKVVETNNPDAEGESNAVEVNIKETGIVVGTSDFTVNSPDEVFLSLSGNMNNDGTANSECVDDWGFDIRPQIPKSLLTELSQTLKSRKTDFIEREKHALNRKGLQDIDNLSSSYDEDSDENEDSHSRKKNSLSDLNIRYKRHVTAQDFSHSSDSDDEMDPFESGAFLTKLKLGKKYQSEPYSDSDSSLLDVVHNNETICESQVKSFKPSVSSTSSLANLAALRSQMWGNNKEECYSDGSDS